MVWPELVLLFLIFGYGWWLIEIPDEIKLPKWIMSRVGGYPPFLAYFSNLPEATMDTWLTHVIAEIERNGDGSVLTAFRKPFLVQTRCFLPCSTSDCCVTNNAVENYFEVNSGGRKESCFLDGKRVGCSAALRTSVVKSISYNGTQIVYRRKQFSGRDRWHSQCIEKVDDAVKCMPVLDDHMPTTYLLLENFDSDKNDKDDRIFLSLEENITLYRQMDCSSGKCSNLPLNMLSDRSKICVCGKCVTLRVADLTTNSAILKIIVSEDGRNITDAFISDNENRNEITFLNSIQMMSVHVVITKHSGISLLPRYYEQRGRFHCPSEVTCPMELFYLFFNIFAKDTDELQFEMIPLIALCFYVLYVLSNTKFDNSRIFSLY